MINDNIMLGVPVGGSFAENLKFDLYDDGKKRLYVYLGLYKDKEIFAVGKVLKVVIFEIVNGELKCDSELTDDEKRRFLEYKKHCELSDPKFLTADSQRRIFFVDKFYRTNYINVGTMGIMGGKKFLLDEILKVASTTEEIAYHLDGQIWELEKGTDIKPYPKPNNRFIDIPEEY